MNESLALLREAATASERSHDPRTRVGCLIYDLTRGVLVRAANMIPSGLSVARPSEHFQAPSKYLWIEHAERRAIFKAARCGVAVGGTTMYLYGGFPCAECARAIVEAGIVQLVFTMAGADVEHWEASYSVSRIMFEEAGVNVLSV